MKDAISNEVLCMFCQKHVLATHSEALERELRHTLWMHDSMQPYHTKCRHEMRFPTLASSKSHQDFILGISYHCANFRILACTSDQNRWSSTENRIKITLLQSKHIKDRKKSHVSFHHKERISLPIHLET